MPEIRRFPFYLSLLVFVLGTAGGLLAQSPELVLLQDGLENATSLANAGDDRLFVGLRDGRILIYVDGELAPFPFLDIRDRVRFASGMDGFYSLAFHPDYPDVSVIFALYVDQDLQTVVSKFVVSKNPDLVDPGTEVVLLEIDQSVGMHDGNHLAFGPDGFLYIATGESGPGFDPLCLSQDPSSLQGKILRIDVDRGGGASPFYGVPGSNPFVDVEGAAPELWATGLRNPWRFSFDRETGDLWIGDVGENSREEIDFQPAASSGGENYGWKTLEGSLCLENSAGCSESPPGCDSSLYTAPVLEYETGADGNCAVVGGFVYRGSRLPELDGDYLYGDFCSGRIWRATTADGIAWTAADTGLAAPGLVTFGEDRNGELYLVAGDALYRLDPPGAVACEEDPQTLCLNNGRFQVTARWQVAEEDPPTAADGARLAGGDGGYFWFFEESNPELFVKVLDACALSSEHYWVFIAGLTDVGTRIEVTDTTTGEVRVYEKGTGIGFEAVRDTEAFATCP